MLIVGSGDIYQKIISKNSSLRERLVEISLGTFRSISSSWKFIAEGLTLLDVNYPVLWKSVFGKQLMDYQKVLID